MGLQAMGQIQQSQAAASAAKYNAQIAGNNAQIATNNATFAGQEGDQQAAISQAKTRAKGGAIIAEQAAAGIDVNKGSAPDVRASNAETGMLDAMTIRSNAAKRAYGYQTESASDTAQGSLDLASAKNDITSGYIKAGTSVLGSASEGYNSGAFSSWQNGNSIDAGQSDMLV